MVTDQQAANSFALQLSNQVMFQVLFQALAETGLNPDEFLKGLYKICETAVDAVPIPGASETVVALAKKSAKSIIRGVILNSKVAEH
jgi:hypothetical protein